MEEAALDEEAEEEAEEDEENLPALRRLLQEAAETAEATNDTPALFHDRDDPDNQAILVNGSYWGQMEFRPKLDPANGWAIPFVTGHKYRMTIGTNLDFMRMNILMSENWKEDDKSIYLVHPFIDGREAITVDVSGIGRISNNTIPDDPEEYSIGQNAIYNETETREVHLILNGKHEPASPFAERSVFLQGWRCAPGRYCNEIVDWSAPYNPDDPPLLWSDPATWGG